MGCILSLPVLESLTAEHAFIVADLDRNGHSELVRSTNDSIAIDCFFGEEILTGDSTVRPVVDSPVRLEVIDFENDGQLEIIELREDVSLVEVDR